MIKRILSQPSASLVNSSHGVESRGLEPRTLLLLLSLLLLLCMYIHIIITILVIIIIVIIISFFFSLRAESPGQQPRRAEQ